MRIAIDLQACQNSSRGRGIARYAMALTRAMCRAGRGHEFRVLLNGAFPGTIGPVREDLEGCVRQEDIHVMAFDAETGSAYPANAWRTRAAELLRAEVLDAMAPDLVFVPSLFEGYHDPTVVSVEPERHVTAVTVFDFIPADYPDVYLPVAGTRAAYARRLSQAAHADVLLPISEFVGAQAGARLGVPAERITPIPLGVEAHFRPLAAPPEARRALLARYGVTRPFVLNTSPFEFRKNLEGLLAGYGALPRPLREAHQLVIVGRMSPPERDRLQWLAREAGIGAGGLVLAGFVPDEDLVALYGACELFVFPSLSEGFGLPVLEAMACGAAVIGSDATSIPEVIGRADMLFPPRDAQVMAERMARVLTDPEVRAELGAAGLARAAPFTWERTAERTLDAFEAALARRSPPRPAAGGPCAVGLGRERPALALVAAASGADGPSARGVRPDAVLADLVHALAAGADVTLVSGDLQVTAELAIAGELGLEAFAEQAAGFDGVVHLLDPNDDDARPLKLLEAFPGPVVMRPPETGRPRPDRPASAQDAFGAGGWPALLALSDAAAASSSQALRLDRVRAAATAVLAAPSSAAASEWSELAARLQALPAGPHQRLRAFAASLPARARNRGADSEDLARLAEAWVRAEAAHRPPRVWLDVSGLAEVERPTPEALAGLAALLRAGGPGLRCVAADVRGRYRTADDRAAMLLGLRLGEMAPPSSAIARPGDRLVVCEGWADAGADAARAFADAGAGVVCTAGAERDLEAGAATLFARLAELPFTARAATLAMGSGDGAPPGEAVGGGVGEAWLARA